jgi:hypothetical protein
MVATPGTVGTAPTEEVRLGRRIVASLRIAEPATRIPAKPKSAHPVTLITRETIFST